MDELRKSKYDHRDTYVIRLIVGAVAICVFFLMHYLYTSGIGLRFDLAVGETMRSLRSPSLNAIMIPITHTANWKTLVGIAVILLIIDAVKWKKIIYPLATATCIINLLIYKLFKALVQRPRPDRSFWLVLESGFSFPSGHSMNGMFCYGMMIYLLWRNCENKLIRNLVTIFLCILIPLIALSRVYCGVHHPTDVIAGLSAGLAMLMVSTVILDEIMLLIDKRPTA